MPAQGPDGAIVRGWADREVAHQGTRQGVAKDRLSRLVLLVLLSFVLAPARAQFYNGSMQEYGKNRVQYQDFLWQYYRFQDIETYFYKGGRDVARYVSISGHRNKREMERFFDYTLDDRIQFLVYNSLGDFRQSNVGLGVDDRYNIGGVARIVGTKVFVYNEGDHELLERQVRSGIAEMMIDQMMYGGNWRQVIKNSTLLNLPEWFTKGLVAYCAGPWDARSAGRIRDGVLGTRFKRFNRLEGDDAALAGLIVWTYVAETYGVSVIPNILYMTRVSRNPENGFKYVLGTGLQQLTQECMDHYRAKFMEEDRLRADRDLEELKVRTRKARTYAEFKLSPDGRYAAWTSNESGQYKVWLHDRTTGKTRRIAKGEKKLDRIIDRSWPVLAWHPTSRALTWTTEKKGELYLTTYTLDDRSRTRKPVFMLEKILSMAYGSDGQTMVFSGVLEGRTDLYLYHVIGNRQDKLTDDQYDDLDPVFTADGTGILFSSDRPDDTLRANADVRWWRSARDIFRYDLRNRSNVLTRLTTTPGVDEREPAPWDSVNYACLSDADGLADRWLLHFDSAITAVDTTVHYRYFTRTQRATKGKRAIMEQDVTSGRGEFAQLVIKDGRYHFFTGRTTGAPEPSGHDEVAPAPGNNIVNKGGAVTDDMSRVIKTDPIPPPDTTAQAVDIHNYRFADEGPAPPPETIPEGTGNEVAATPAPAGKDTLLVTSLTFPEQRNYNVNFATDEVLTQVDNSYDGRFYQSLTGNLNMNPGLSGYTRMAMSDLFEDYKISGGFRLALDLNNNDYFLRLQNIRHRLDKDLVVQRRAIQGVVENAGLAKLHTHMATFRLTWPFSELTSLRGSVMYRHDRAVIQSTDNLSLRKPNAYDQTVGGKLEYVYDSSIPRGLNLWTGWKAKVFGEYYKQIDGQRTDMQVLGLDVRHAMRLHRELTWVTRLAGSTALGSRRVLFTLGGVDNWLFPKVNNSTPIDGSQNYFYQSLAVPMRGFWYNTRNGNSFAVANTEVRVPIFRYLMNRPIRSDLINNFQVVAFADAGTAWTGAHPYAEDNSFNNTTIVNGPYTITIKNLHEPIVWSYGVGLRTRLLGYFVRADWAWGIDDGRQMPRVFQLSLNLDI